MDFMWTTPSIRDDLSHVPLAKMLAACANSNASRCQRALVVVIISVLLSVVATQSSDALALFSHSCTKPCGPYEICFVYESVEYCAQRCAPGRCNDATETCVLQGVPCTEAPCLPIAVCEPISHQVTSSSTPSTDDGDSTTSTACARSCPSIDAPVCASTTTSVDSNGSPQLLSFANICYFEEANCNDPTLTLVSSGLCESDRQLNVNHNAQGSFGISGSSLSSCNSIACSTIEDPVCTSAGTMRNHCYWKKAACATSSITFISRGRCDAPQPEPLPTCPTSCGNVVEYAPVCGSNGVIYGSECLFRQAKCARGSLRLLAKDISYCTAASTSASATFRTVVTSVFN